MKNLTKEGRRHPANYYTIRILFLLPACLLVIYALFIPFFWNGVLSFQKWNGFAPPEWVGFDNYTKALSDSNFRLGVKNTLILAVFTTTGAVALGVFFSALVYRVGKTEGAVYRLIAFMPAMLPASVVGLLFRFFFNPDMGLLNNFLRLIGQDQLTTAWLENSHTVMWCLIFVGIWKGFGTTMLLSYAAMQMIPSALFESCKLDGASYPRQFVSITLPLIRPVITTALIFTLNDNLKSYALVATMTGGGPGNQTSTVPFYMLKTAFTFGKFGYTAAQGVIATVIILLLVGFIKRVSKGETYEY